VKTCVVFLSGLIGMAAGCSSAAESRSARTSDTSRFALDLYEQVRKEKGNLLLSPQSISNGLAAAGLGARGQTAQEIAMVLRLSLSKAGGQPMLGKQLQDPAEIAQRSESYQVRMVTALWLQESFPLRPDYQKQASDKCGMETTVVDFSDPKASCRQINAWVRDISAGKIPEIISPRQITNESRMLLTNALYVRSNCAHAFEEKETRQEVFWVDKAESVQVQMMHQTQEMAYGENDLCQILAVPCHAHVFLIILLPKAREGLPVLEKGLSTAHLEDWMQNRTLREVDVSLPRFRIAAETNLEQTLQQMGMRHAFSDEADFSGISDNRPLWLSAVAHKAVIDVNERGIEAAASTRDLIVGADLEYKHAVFRVDHPFIFIVYKESLGGILFLGRLVNPRQDMN
jgi:serpin B